MQRFCNPDATLPDMWTYKGIDVFPADLNTSGIRWYARTASGILRADSKASMRNLITEHKEHA